jgi:hypothetical protein
MTGITSVSATGDADIDGLLSGVRWNTTNLTFSFPSSGSLYGFFYANGEPTNNFQAFNSTQQDAVRSVLTNYSAVINVTFTEMTETTSQHADLRFAHSSSPSTAWAYYPSSTAEGGDAWFNPNGWYANPIEGTYAYQTMLHEIGHAMGLDHGQASDHFGAMTYAHDSMEYSVMTYRSYVGHPLGGYTNEYGGYAQSLMMYDIAALQTMYGANYNTNSGATVYSWSATTGQMSINGIAQGVNADNRIFETLWDGGGIDTYNFSNYATDLTVNLRPGEWTTTSSAQLANLGGGHMAAGNVANALMYNGDTRSLIENANGGSGNDSISGNTAANLLWGNGGNDTLSGLEGNDVLDGGSGNDTLIGGVGSDTFVFASSYAADVVTDFALASDRVDLSAMTSVTGFSNLLSLGSQVGSSAVFNFGGGDTLTLQNVQLGNLSSSNFVLAASSSNQAPVITSNGGGASASISIAENSTAVATVTATDADVGTNFGYSIVGGADAARFTINPVSGALSFVTGPNFEAPSDAGGNNVYDVVVRVSDGVGGTDDQAIAVTVTNQNEAPVISSNGGGGTASIPVAENGSAVTTVTATDPDVGGNLGYSIVGGADAARFTINPVSGALSFVTTPNFEAPVDVGGNNVYDVVVRVSDGVGGYDDQAIAVTVANQNEAPVIFSNGGGSTASISVAENGTAVTTVAASDVDAGTTLSYAISGGADASRFTINAVTGALSFVTAPNFEAPTDAGANNVYDVVVLVTDGLGGTDTQALAVTVTNQNEAPAISSNGGGSTAAIAVSENTTAVTTVVATDVDAAATLSYAISGGVDASRFTINASTGALSFVTAPNVATPTDAGGNNVYDVVVQVSDGFGGVDTQALAVTVTALALPPVITSNGGGNSAAVSVAENGMAVTTVTASAQLGQTLGYSIIGGADAARFTINASTGALSFVSAPNYEAPTDAGGNNVYDVVVQVSNGLGGVDTQAVAVTVTNQNEAPAISSNGGGSSAGISITENTTAVTTVAATDVDAGTALSYSIAGGTDASRFIINAVTGALSFVTAPNFEAPTDTGANNVYDVAVQVSDGSGGVDVQNLAIAVTNRNEAPVITSNGGGNTALISLAENITSVTTVRATDPDGQAVTYSIVGGVDAARFAINSTSGLLSFTRAPDFERPNDVGRNNAYDVVVQASDGSGGLIDTQSLAVQITNVSENAANKFDKGRGNYQVVADITGANKTVVDVSTGISSGTGEASGLEFGNESLNTTSSDTFRFNDLRHGMNGWDVAATGDFNGDGSTDVMWKSKSGSLASWTMQDAQIGAKINMNHDMLGWDVVATGDFNGDGTDDLMWKNSAGQLGAWLMEGGRIGGTLDMNHDMLGWDVVATGDFNGDGSADLMWMGSAGNLGVWLMQDGRIGGTLDMNHDMLGWNVVATGDFNGDGSADLMWMGSAGNLGVWLMQGGRIAATLDMNHDMPGWTVSATGDFDGNGRTDVMWDNRYGVTGVWLMDGGKIDATVGFSVDGWTPVATGDYDGNGVSDIIWEDARGGVSSWLL